MNSKTAAALVLIGSVMFGFMGLNTRVLRECGFPLESVTFFRLLVTIIVLGLALLIIDRKLFRVRREHILLFLIIGFCKALMDYTLIASQNQVTLGFATALQMTAPIFVIILSYFIYKQKVTHAGVLGTLVCIIGTVLYSGVLFDEAPISGIGLVDGMICGVATAGFMITTKELLVKGYHPVAIIFYSFVIAILFLLPFTDIPLSFQLACDTTALVNIILLGIFCTAIPYVFIAYGQKCIDTLRVTIYSTLEVVAAAIVGWIFFKEYLDLSNILGLALIILAIVVITLGEVRKGQQSTDPGGNT